MNRYRAHVTVTTTWTASEDISFEIEAENEKEALEIMKESYKGHCGTDIADAELDSQYIEASNLEVIEGEETIRCDKTDDMFGSGA